MPDQIVAGREIEEDLTGGKRLRPDFCIIGSGAGGGVCALILAQAGFDVLVLEEGPNIPRGRGGGGECHVRPALVERESVMYRRLYQEGAGRLTKDGGILVLQGRCLGGGTAVNWSACLPPPERTLEVWESDYKLDDLTWENLQPLLLEVAGYLNVHSDTRYNSSARVLMDGCQGADCSYQNLPNNTSCCRECGSCGTGCPYDRKLSGFVKWLHDAANVSGTPARIYTDAKVDDLLHRDNKVTLVRGRFLDGSQKRTGFDFQVEPTLGVILAAGAIGSPSILWASGIEGYNSMVGKRTHIHPITMCFGRYDAPTHPAYGVPDNMMTGDFADGETGYLIETGSFFPVMTSAASLEFGADLRRSMREFYPRGAILYAHHNSGFDQKFDYGKVRLDRHWQPVFEYELHPRNKLGMIESLKKMSQIHFAAGAREVYHVTNPVLKLRSPDEIGNLDGIEFGVGKTTTMTVHVMGGCAMGGDPKRSVVDPNFKLRGFSNAWVADGSLFPTGLGANPQMTIYSLALMAARKIAQAQGGGLSFRLPVHQQHQEYKWPWPRANGGAG